MRAPNFENYSLDTYTCTCTSLNKKYDKVVYFDTFLKIENRWCCIQRDGGGGVVGHGGAGLSLVRVPLLI